MRRGIGLGKYLVPSVGADKDLLLIKGEGMETHINERLLDDVIAAGPGVGGLDH